MEYESKFFILMIAQNIPSVCTSSSRVHEKYKNDIVRLQNHLLRKGEYGSVPPSPSRFNFIGNDETIVALR